MRGVIGNAVSRTAKDPDRLAQPPILINVITLCLYSTVYLVSAGGQRRPWSDYADTQSDQGLRCPYKAKRDFRMKRLK